MGDFIFILSVSLYIDPVDIMDMKSLAKLVVYSTKSVTCKELAAFPDNWLEIRIQLG
jgi:hypothetical protein